MCGKFTVTDSQSVVQAPGKVAVPWHKDERAGIMRKNASKKSRTYSGFSTCLLALALHRSKRALCLTGTEYVLRNKAYVLQEGF